jgi:hypothetical protein
MPPPKTRSITFTSRDLLYKPTNFKVAAKFQVKIDGLPDTDIIEQYIGMALHSYCHEQLGKMEASLKRGDEWVEAQKKKSVALEKTEPKKALECKTQIKKYCAGVEQEFNKQAEAIKTQLPKIAEEVWKKQAAENTEYRNYKIKVGLIATFKLILSPLLAVVGVGTGVGGAIGASVVSGGTGAVPAVIAGAAIVVGAVGASLSLLGSALNTLNGALKSEAVVRGNLLAAVATLQRETAKANLAKLTGEKRKIAFITLIKGVPARNVESLLEDHKKLIIGARQKADAVHNGLIKLIPVEGELGVYISRTQRAGQTVDPKIIQGHDKLTKIIDLTLKTTESRLDAMGQAERIHTLAAAALKDAKSASTSGEARLKTTLDILDKINVLQLDWGDLGSLISAVGSVTGMIGSCTK